jgi:DNA-binding transcriptional LysR family regulator
VRTLEERCGVRLLERSTRRLDLTQIGARVLEAASAVTEAPRTIEAVLEEHRDAPVGTLRIATTLDLCERFVAPVAARMVAAHASIDVDVVAADEKHDLIAGRFDVAVRLGAPRDSSYALKKLGSVHEPIVASPALADAWPAARPRELSGAPWARHALLGAGDVLSFRGPRGEHDEVAVRTRARANTGDTVRALAVSGAGFASLPIHLVREDVRLGRLVVVCEGWSSKTVSLYALLPSTKRPPKRVSIFLDSLKRELATAGLGD